MKRRATITIDPKLHARAKQLARQRKTSVSGLFEQFLKGQPEGGGSAVDQMLGSVSLREMNLNDRRGQALAEKYLKQ